MWDATPGNFARLLFVGLAVLVTVRVAPAQDIAIGLSVPLTGPFAAAGNEIRRGMEAAVGSVNRRGGVLRGRKLVLRSADDGCQSDRAAGIARDLSRQGVVAVVSAACGWTLRAAEGVFQPKHIPLISAAVIDPLSADRRQTFYSPTTFGMTAGADKQGTAAALIWDAASAPTPSSSWQTAPHTAANLPAGSPAGLLFSAPHRRRPFSSIHRV